MDSSTWDLLVDLLKVVTGPRIDGDNFAGKLPVGTPIPKELGLFLDTDDAGTLQINRGEIRNAGAQIYLYRSGCRSFSPGDQIFIFEGQLSASSSLVSPHFEGLRAYLEFRELVKTQANFIAADEVYLHEEFGVRFSITAIPFERLGELKPLDKLHQWLNNPDVHKTARTSIFRSMLVEVLHDQADGPLAIVNRWSQLETMFDERYHLFIRGFGVSKVLEDARKEHTDFVKRYQSIVADSGSKLLALPAGFVFLGTQVTPSGSIPWKNEIIVGGALLFSLIMVVMLAIQLLDIRMLRRNIKTQKKEAVERLSSEKSRIDGLFDPLLHRTMWLSGLIGLFIVSSIALFVVALLLFPMTWGEGIVMPQVEQFKHFL